MTIDEKLKAFFEGKKVVILGFGREGRSTLKLLGSCNCKSITVADMNPVPESEAEGCTYVTHCARQARKAVRQVCSAV